jgi:hypothetical protein
MNSADLHKQRKGDGGMEGRKESIALGFKSLTPGEIEYWFSQQASGGDPEVQYRPDFTKELQGEREPMEQRKISPSLNRWEVMG